MENRKEKYHDTGAGVVKKNQPADANFRIGGAVKSASSKLQSRIFEMTL